MKPWVEEVFAAVGIGESHSTPLMGFMLSLSLAIAVQTPLVAIQANNLFLPEPESTAFFLGLVVAAAVAGNVMSWRPASTFVVLNRPSWGVLWSVVLGLCLASVPAVQWSDMSNSLVAFILGALSGTALTFVLMFEGHLYTRTYIPDIVRRSFIACGVAVMFTSVIVARVPQHTALIICGVLNLANAPLLAALLRNAPAIGDYADFRTYHDRRAEAGLFIAKVALPVVCAGTVVCMFGGHLNCVSANTAAPSLGDELCILVYLVVEYVILSFTTYGVRRFGWPFAQLHSFLIPIVGLCGTVCVGATLGGQAVYDAGSIAIFALFLSLIWSFAGGASLEYLVRSASLYGMTIGCLAIGVLLGCALNQLELHGTVPGGIVGALVCLVMAVGFLPPRPAPNLSHSTYSTCLRSSVRHAEHADEAPDEAPAPQEQEREPERGTETPAQPAGRFMRRCKAVAKTFLLSARETEVLCLLAKGRSMNRIMEELVISEGTAKTHINHVYKKLDVHSRHELVNLIESYDLEELEP